MTPDRQELAGKLEVANRCPKTWGTMSPRHREDDNVLDARHRYTRVVIASGVSRVTDAPIDGDEDVGVDKARGSGSSDQPRDGRGAAPLTFVGAEEVDVGGGLDLPPGGRRWIPAAAKTCSVLATLRGDACCEPHPAARNPAAKSTTAAIRRLSWVLAPTALHSDVPGGRTPGWASVPE
jgi:hypothetical protein